MYEQSFKKPGSVPASSVDVRSNSFLSKVYGYMAIGILISAVVAFLAALGFQAWFNTSPSETVYTTYIYVMIASFVGLIITSVVISFISLKGKRSIIVPAIIYSVLMGVVFSEFVLFVDSYIVGTAFAITAMTFAIMYFIGKVAKNLSWVGNLGYGLFFGAMMMSLFFLLLYFVAPGALTPFAIILDSVIFVAILLITMFDVWRIQQIANRGAQSNNLALYCAFSLYVDFMYILMRLIFILIRLFGSSRR